jgi:hypothetical protein
VRIAGCCREYRRSRTGEGIVQTHTVAIEAAAEAYIHTWAGAMLVLPMALPGKKLPPLRPLGTEPPPFVTARVDPVVRKSMFFFSFSFLF